MAKPRPEKKRKRAPPAKRRVLPMELRIGDRLADETGEWQVVGQLYTTAGGKTAHVRVQRAGQPDVTDLNNQTDETKPQPMPDLKFQYDGHPQTMRTLIVEPGAVAPPQTSTR